MARAPALLLIVGLLLPASASATRLAILRLDPLGVDREIVARLEGLLRMELSRLVDAAMPSPRRVARLTAGRPALRECTGKLDCMVEAGQLLGVDQIITGNVGGLAGNYVVNLKIVDVNSRRELRRTQETLSGEPDQLIEAVRVAAYRLAAPDRLRGSLEVLANIAGAQVFLDGRLLGRTPLAPQHALDVGPHSLRVTREGYTDVVQQVAVRLQKVARVVVTLQTPRLPEARRKRAPPVAPWYTRGWFWAATGVAAVGLGVVLGLALSSSPEVDCAAQPARCGLAQ